MATVSGKIFQVKDGTTNLFPRTVIEAVYGLEKTIADVETWVGTSFVKYSHGIYNPTSAVDLNNQHEAENTIQQISWDFNTYSNVSNRPYSSASAASVLVLPNSWGGLQFYTDYNSNTYYIRNRYSTVGWKSWVQLYHTGNFNPADYAKLGTYNNLMFSGNEFTFASAGYNGAIHINSRTASGERDGNISSYHFRNAADGYAYTYAAGYAIPNGTSSQFLKADGSVDSTAYLYGAVENNIFMQNGSETDTWANLGYADSHKGKADFKIVRHTNGVGAHFGGGSMNYGSTLFYGGSDTRGYMSLAYSGPLVVFGGGALGTNSASSAPSWYLKLTGTSGTLYDLAQIVTHAANGNSAYNSLGNYLPLKAQGETIYRTTSGQIVNFNNSKGENEEAYLILQSNSTSKAAVGWSTTFGAYIYNYPSAKYLGIKDDGTPHYHGNTLWHAGNANLSTVSWTASGFFTPNHGNHLTVGPSTWTYRTVLSSSWTSATGDYLDIGVPSQGGGSPSVIRLLGNGNVGVGVTTPQYKLDVNGTVRANTFQKVDGTSSQFLKADGSVDSNTYLTTGTAESTYAKLKTWNNLMHSGNEFTFASAGHSGDIYINYRTASGARDGNIASYRFLNGGGGYTSIVASKFIVNDGTSTQFLKADGSLDSNTYMTTDTAQTITGVKTFADAGTTLLGADLYRHTSSVSYAYPATAWNAWHDHFAFLRVHTLQDVQVTTDGSTWTASSKDLKPLFIHKENTFVQILDAADRAFRFTLYSAGSFHVCNIYWLSFGTGYSSPFSSFTLKAECSADNSTWTTWGEQTFTSSQSSYCMRLGYLPGNQKYFRFTFTKTDNLTTGTVRICAFSGLTFRKGDQGLGKENSYPFSWDTGVNLLPLNAGVSTLGTASYKWHTVYGLTGNFGDVKTDYIVDESAKHYFIGKAASGLGSGYTGALIYAYGNNPIHFYTNSNPRMYIGGTGNVGIGTYTPSCTLEVLHAPDPGSSGQITSQFLAYSQSPYGIVFRGFASGTHAIQVERKGTSSEFFPLALQHRGGNVGIGKLSPSYKLDVNGSTQITGKLILPKETGTSQLAWWNGTYRTWITYLSGVSGSTSPTGAAMTSGEVVTSWSMRSLIQNNSGYGWVWESSAESANAASTIMMELSSNTGVLRVKGGIYSNGYVSALGTASSSDAKLKDDITTISYDRAKAVLSALNPREWTWNALTSKEGERGAGMVAQEVIPILPDTVKEIGGNLTLEYNTLFAYGLAMTKYLVPAVESLEERVARLERENEELKRQLTN